MRSTIVTAVAALALMGAGALTVPAAYADQDQPDLVATTGELLPGAVEEMQAEAALPDPALDSPSAQLATAQRVTTGQALPQDPSATLALRDLWVSKSQLRGTERRAAEAMLARPSDGSNDPAGFGYTVPEQPPLCNARLCLHYVGSGIDAPPSAEWAAQSLAVMDAVWASEVDSLGYRPPLTDGIKGGGPQFDVYLKDLGGDLYGFCSGESKRKSRTATGYCVLDNDFSAAQFPTGTPEGNLRVTAAHEFFHAIQYAYDYAEDRWMMEATATWMEERFATDVNDNRQYLNRSQLYLPDMPLDMFSQSGGFQYGNWIFWEYLSTNYGVKFVNKAWKQAGSLKGDGGKNSIAALQKLLKGKGGLTKVYAKFAAGNLTPAATYPEGADYPAPRVKGQKALSKSKRSKRFRTRINHLSSTSYRFRVGQGLSAKKWKLRVNVSGPMKRTSPAAAVTIQYLNGKVKTKMVRLRRNGGGSLKVPFSGRSISAVSVTLVNGSTRYRCNRRTVLACNGVPLDDKARFSVRGQVVKR